MFQQGSLNYCSTVIPLKRFHDLACYRKWGFCDGFQMVPAWFHDVKCCRFLDPPRSRRYATLHSFLVRAQLRFVRGAARGDG